MEFLLGDKGDKGGTSFVPRPRSHRSIMIIKITKDKYCAIRGVLAHLNLAKTNGSLTKTVGKIKYFNTRKHRWNEP